MNEFDFAPALAGNPPFPWQTGCWFSALSERGRIEAAPARVWYPGRNALQTDYRPVGAYWR